MLISAEKWLWRTFAEALAIGFDQSRLQQIELRAPIHLSLYELQACDLSFGLPVGPWRDDRIPDGGHVLFDPVGK